MPELPEVETIRIALAKKITGKVIADIQVLEPKQWSGDIKQVLNQEIVTLERKGKYLSIKLSNNKYLNIHLKMSGQVLFADDVHNAVFNKIIPRADSNKLPGKSTRIIINFSDNSGIFFNDIRKFGWIKVSDKIDGPPSPDVYSDEFTLEYFQSIFNAKIKQPIKNFLLDQNKLAGIGNIYANDSLFEAGILPERAAGSLTTGEIERLYEAIKLVISEGVKFRGSSAQDENFILPDGSSGGYQHHFRVYHREHQPCIKCGTEVIRVKHHGRSSFYCPHCQK
jgi:formamidopyrimidine-DNA glycosylase